MPSALVAHVRALAHAPERGASVGLAALQLLQHWKDPRSTPLRERVLIDWVEDLQYQTHRLRELERMRTRGKQSAYLVASSIVESHRQQHPGQAWRIANGGRVQHQSPRYYTHRDELIARAAETWLHDPTCPALYHQPVDATDVLHPFLLPQGQERAALGRALEDWYGALAHAHPRPQPAAGAPRP